MKKVIIIAVVLLVLTAATVVILCLLPKNETPTDKPTETSAETQPATPTERFKRTYFMHSLTKNGQKDAEYTVAVEAEKSRDSIRFSFTAARDGVEVFSNEQELPLTSLAEDGSNAYVFHSSWYDKATNGVAFITFYTDVDFQVFAASYKDRSYIGSTDAHFDVESVKEALDYKENVFLEDVFGEG